MFYLFAFPINKVSNINVRLRIKKHQQPTPSLIQTLVLD